MSKKTVIFALSLSILTTAAQAETLNSAANRCTGHYLVSRLSRSQLGALRLTSFKVLKKILRDPSKAPRYSVLDYEPNGITESLATTTYFEATDGRYPFHGEIMTEVYFRTMEDPRSGDIVTRPVCLLRYVQILNRRGSEVAGTYGPAETSEISEF